MSAVTAVLWRCVRPLVHEHWCARPPHSCTAVKTYVSAASSQKSTNSNKPPLKKPKTPQGRFDETEQSSKDPLERFPDDVNPITKEKGGPRGPEPTRYGDWERKGRCIDF